MLAQVEPRNPNPSITEGNVGGDGLPSPRLRRENHAGGGKPGRAVSGRGYGAAIQGLRSKTPVGSKSAVFLVITWRPWRRAVAAMRPSLA